MSALSRVREKYKTPTQGTSKTSKSPSAGFAGSSHRTIQKNSTPSAGFAGSLDGQSEKIEQVPTTEAETTEAMIGEYRHGLVLGRLHLCCNCAHYTVATDAKDPGHCRQHSEPTWPLVPFSCGSFEVSSRPKLPTHVPDPDGRAALLRRARA